MVILMFLESFNELRKPNIVTMKWLFLDIDRQRFKSTYNYDIPSSFVTQILPNSSHIWSSAGNSLLDLQKIELRVKRIKYNGVMDLIADVQAMLKGGMRYTFSGSVASSSPRGLLLPIGQTKRNKQIVDPEPEPSLPQKPLSTNVDLQFGDQLSKRVQHLLNATSINHHYLLFLSILMKDIREKGKGHTNSCMHMGWKKSNCLMQALFRPKKGTQYGAPFNEEEWEDDDIANCSNALVTVGPLENGTTAMEMVAAPQITHTVCLTEPESSIVTLSANEGHEEVPVDDIDMMFLEDIAFLLGLHLISSCSVALIILNWHDQKANDVGSNILASDIGIVENVATQECPFDYPSNALIDVGSQPSFLSSVAISTLMMSASAISFVANNVRALPLLMREMLMVMIFASCVSYIESTRSFTTTTKYGSMTPVPSYIFPIFVGSCIKKCLSKVYDHGNLRRLWCSFERKEIQDFADWILNIGNGKIGGKNDGEANVEFPDDMLIPDSDDNIGSIIHETYPDLLRNLYYSDYFQERDILAPTHELVDMINDRVGGYYLRNTAYGH
ncbi:ATP-dependent DNA helicase PIF1-like protein [Tanacetum coccineum]